VVGPDRVADANWLLEQYDCDLIIADDGLQHYALARTVEIAVLDGKRKLGNGFCIPAGPLRERKQRLNTVDIVVVNEGVWPAAYEMTFQQTEVVNLLDNSIVKSLKDFYGQQVHAVAGIGNPTRYFEQIKSQGIRPICHPFPDHHAYSQEDFDFSGTIPVLMTEKDAVKCQQFAKPNFWYVTISSVIDVEVYKIIEDTIRKNHGQKTT
jgi:tetraacyldisaccharide 4'-kinase